MQNIPLLVFDAITILIALLSYEAGWRIGYSRHRRRVNEREAPLDAAVGATLGLLAFLLAFTFGMAADRYEDRRQIVLEEATAIDAAYLRADFLSESGRAEIRSLLRDYLALRTGGEAAVLSADGRLKAAGLHHQLWLITTREQRANDNESTALFTDSINRLIELDAVRATALRNRIPVSMWGMLGIVTFLSLAALGYVFGLSGTRSWMITILLVMVFTAVIMLIADLDGPQEGLIQVSQQPLIDLLGKITAGMP
jgi:hypothetical protein